MQKIPTIFERDWEGDRSRVLDKPHPDCGWVFAGDGIATRKYDGTCCLIRYGRLYKRHEVREGKQIPAGFEEVAFDDETGKRAGWVPVGDGPEDRWHREAWEHCSEYPDGTYELLGPKIQGNPEDVPEHTLLPHGVAQHLDPPTDYDALGAWLATMKIEGVVWHHPDGRMAKIKKRDFGLKRVPESVKA